MNPAGAWLAAVLEKRPRSVYVGCPGDHKITCWVLALEIFLLSLSETHTPHPASWSSPEPKRGGAPYRTEAGTQTPLRALREGQGRAGRTPTPGREGLSGPSALETCPGHLSGEGGGKAQGGEPGDPCVGPALHRLCEAQCPEHLGAPRGSRGPQTAVVCEPWPATLLTAAQELGLTGHTLSTRAEGHAGAGHQSECCPALEGPRAAAEQDTEAQAPPDLEPVLVTPPGPESWRGC